MIGKTVSHYRIIDKIGEGGMGVVYKAVDEKLNRTVALKFLSQKVSSTETDRKRFIHEAQAASGLDHSNICSIYEIDETSDGQLFMVMPSYEGIPLNKKIEQGPLPIAEAINTAIQIAEGLQTAHEKGIVHRDIKSGNIFITQKGQVKILDFGLARSAEMSRMTKTGTTIGTIVYMSPEQARGEKVNHRTDIWSLGVILYEMISGGTPFQGDHYESILHQIINKEPEPVTSLRSNVPMELERIVKKAMEKDCSMRYQSVEDMLVDLKKLSRESESTLSIEAPKKKTRTLRKRMYLYGGAAVLALIIIAVILFLPPEQTEVIDSIAVLPLENLMGDPEQEYFVDGMHEALILELSRISALKVISRTSAMQYKGANKPMQQIARELGVKGLVEGSVLREGDHVRITVQLIDGMNDMHLWAESFDRELRSILFLHKDVARAIAEEIKLTLTPEEKAQIAQARTIDPEAYQFYLKGNFHFMKLTEDGFQSAVEHFKKSIEIDSTWAPAHAGLAMAYIELSGFNALARPPDELRSEALSAALKALELDKNLAEAHFALGRYRQMFEWDWDGAADAYRRGLQLNPSASVGLIYTANYLTSLGRYEEAVELCRRTIESDPLLPVAYNEYGFALQMSGRKKEGLEQYQKSLELAPNYWQTHHLLANLYFRMERLEEAETALNKVSDLMGNIRTPAYLAWAGYNYGKYGNHEKALGILKELEQLALNEYMPAYPFAFVHIGLGEYDRAVEFLEEAYNNREYFLIFLKVHYVFDPLRDNPRFQDLLQRMNFPEN